MVSAVACSLDWNHLCNKLISTICAFKTRNTSIFEKILILLESSSCNCRLITQQFDMFVVSHELVCLLFPTINFHVSYQNLHVVMVTEFHFLDVLSAIVQKTEVMNLCVFLYTCISFHLCFLLMFCEVCCIWQHLWIFVQKFHMML